MEENQGIREQMAAAANEAAKEIPQLKDAQDVANWIAKWYMKAGYKNLSRRLMTYFGLGNWSK